MELSIIITAYNSEKYISKCIDSCLRLRGLPIEIVVINDGSTDRTLQIVNEKYAALQNLYVYTTENRGLSAARNYGMKKAKGDYIIFLDSDDWLRADINMILEDESSLAELDVLFYNYQYIDEMDGWRLYPEREYPKLVNQLGGQVVRISATSDNHINAMDMNSDYGDGANPVILKSEFILSLCEHLMGGSNLGPKEKSIIDRCTAKVYRVYQQGNYQGVPPTLQDFREELLRQEEPEAKEIALAIELFTNGSLNTFAKNTNVDTNSRIICYDILDLGKQLLPIGMLVVLDSILNRITANRSKGRNTYIFIDEIYLLFQHEYSANFLFTLWKRVRKYGAYCTGITQNVDDLLQSHTARTMLANSEFIVMLNQAATDRTELAKLLSISDTQLSYITNVGVGQGLLKVGSSLVPFKNEFPKDTKLYKLMTTKPGEGE